VRVRGFLSDDLVAGAVGLEEISRSRGVWPQDQQEGESPQGVFFELRFMVFITVKVITEGSLNSLITLFSVFCFN